jgi:hypothetical protein
MQWSQTNIVERFLQVCGIFLAAQKKSFSNIPDLFDAGFLDNMLALEAASPGKEDATTVTKRLLVRGCVASSSLT